MSNLIPIPGAKDEAFVDERDWRMGTGQIKTLASFPSEFIIDDGRYQNQALDGLLVSCTAQATTNSANNSMWIKADKKTYFEGKDLWQKMKDYGMTFSDGASLIDAVRVAKEMGIIAGYYQVSSLLEILTALYNTDTIVSGSYKIDWGKCKDGLVREVSSGSSHAFNIVGWDKNKRIGQYVGAIRCENSYGSDYQDAGGFWIPFDLVGQILFPITRKALIVVPEWTKLSQEERYERFMELRKKYEGATKD